MQRQKILVTGANGFIGTALCEKLAAEHRTVVGAVRTVTAASDLPTGIERFAIGEIGPHTQWERALSGIDIVIHLAARVHVLGESEPDAISAYRRVNVAGTKKMAQSAAAMGVRRFIYVSTVKVNGNGRPAAYSEHDRPMPADPYGISKYEAEQVLQEISESTDLECVVLRPPLVYGPRVKANFLQLLNMVAKGIPLPLAGVKNKRSLLSVANLIDALVLCIHHPKAAGNTYLITDGEDISTPELIRKTAAALGKPTARLFPCPLSVLHLAAKIAGKSGAVSRLLDSLAVDISKIRSELNWQPRFSLEEGLRETARWYWAHFR